MARQKLRNPAVQKPIKFVVDLNVGYQDDLIIPKDYVSYLT